uniref:Uncharacterized protein n=1 Tax=Nelumbo nucifera TaxID=4432 RepID=A0A822YEZ5_NELNU|nr:TPA_asm: hypothetical protein HUJ06_031529 [Nelumbo nucifera]
MNSIDVWVGDPNYSQQCIKISNFMVSSSATPIKAVDLESGFAPHDTAHLIPTSQAGADPKSSFCSRSTHYRLPDHRLSKYALPRVPYQFSRALNGHRSPPDPIKTNCNVSN